MEWKTINVSILAPVKGIIGDEILKSTINKIKNRKTSHIVLMGYLALRLHKRQYTFQWRIRKMGIRVVCIPSCEKSNPTLDK